MNNLILGAVLAVALFFSLVGVGEAKADGGPIVDWNIIVTIPGENYDRHDRRYDRYNSCVYIANKYERAMNRGQYRKARYWETRWYDEGCNRHHRYTEQRRRHYYNDNDRRYYDGDRDDNRHNRH